VVVNPVPRGLMTRRQGGSVRSRTAPLVRVPRTLPRILPPAEADRLVAALRTDRDRAMVLAMLLAGLRRCEVLGLRFADVQVADRRLAVTEGKGGHHRVVPAAEGRSPRAAGDPAAGRLGSGHQCDASGVVPDDAALRRWHPLPLRGHETAVESLRGSSRQQAGALPGGDGCFQ